MASSKQQVALFLAVVAVLLLQASSQPPVDATMVWTRFDEDGGSGPAACDGKYHDGGDLMAALSAEWYGDGFRCGRGIMITSKDTGKTVRATVVDEVDDRDKTIAATTSVWQALGFADTNLGEVAVGWFDANGE